MKDDDLHPRRFSLRAMVKLLFFCSAVLAVGFWLSPRPAIVHPPGVIAPNEPVQQAIAKPAAWNFRGHTITPLATFEVDARVLSTARYWVSSRETRLSSYDFVLGWGEMSNQAVLDTMTISQTNRWFEWRWSNKRPPISDVEIISHSANMHMVAADDTVLTKLGNVGTGQLVHIRGSLVQAKAADGWTWTSSMTRNDAGKGACELIWVEEITARDK